MALTLPVASRTEMVDALVDLIDTANPTPGELVIYSGTRPAPDAVPGAATALATVVLDNPAFAPATAGAAILGVPTSVAASASGTASWFRIVDGADASVFDGSVTATGGGGDLELATTALTVGLTVDITSGTVTMPATDPTP
jgi:hypothetical protein